MGQLRENGTWYLPILSSGNKSLDRSREVHSIQDNILESEPLYERVPVKVSIVSLFRNVSRLFSLEISIGIVLFVAIDNML